MSEQNKGVSLVLATALISGFSIFINQYGVKKIDPFFYTFAKNLAAAIFLLAVLFLGKSRRDFLKLNRRDKIRLILIALLGGALGFLLYFKGLALTSAVKAGFIHKTLFVFVGFFSAVLLKERAGKNLLFGLLSLTLGSALFLGIRPQAVNLGDLLVLAAVLVWSIEIIIAKQVLVKLSGLAVASVRLALGSLFILLFLLASGRAPLFTALNWQILFWTLATGLLLFGYNWTFYSGLKRLAASQATAILTLGMPLTGILSLIFNEKSWSAEETVGAVLIMLGAALASGIIGAIAARVKKFLKLSQAHERA